MARGQEAAHMAARAAVCVGIEWSFAAVSGATVAVCEIGKAAPNAAYAVRTDGVAVCDPADETWPATVVQIIGET